MVSVVVDGGEGEPPLREVDDSAGCEAMVGGDGDRGAGGRMAVPFACTFAGGSTAILFVIFASLSWLLARTLRRLASDAFCTAVLVDMSCSIFDVVGVDMMCYAV